MSNDPVKHHTVPRFYLKGFTIPGSPEEIYVFRPGQKPFCTGVAGIAFENHFYSFEDDQGVRDSSTVEISLAKNIENPGNEVLVKIRNKQTITPKEKLTLSQYISVMLTRVPKHRKRSRPLILKAIEELRIKLETEIKPATTNSVGSIEPITDPMQQVHQILDAYKVKIPSRYNIVIISSKYGSVLNSMTWVLFIARTRQGFLTSDNPVVFDEGIGLVGKDGLSDLVEVTFPISKQVALWATWRKGTDRYLEANEQIVQEINRRTVGAALREVYYQSNPKWVRALVNKAMGNRSWKGILL